MTDKPKKKSKPRRYFLAAANFEAANLTADVDCNWSPCTKDGVNGWTNDDGHFVQYLGDVAELRDVTVMAVYLGLDWYKNPLLADLSQVARAYGVEPVGVAK